MKIASHCRTGEYHLSKGLPCEDSVRFLETDRCMVAAIADGVTACSRAAEGAEIACKAVLDFASREQENIFDYPEEKTAYLLIEHILYFLEKESSDGEDIRSYASTAAGAVIDKQTGRAVLFNLGDGAVYLAHENSFRVCMIPCRVNGNPCLTTTDNAYKAVEIRKRQLLMGEVLLLCTDGFLHFIKNDANAKELLEKKKFEDLNRKLEVCGEADDSSYIAVFMCRK